MAFVLRRIIGLTAVQRQVAGNLHANGITHLLYASNTTKATPDAVKDLKEEANEHKLNLSDSCIKRLREICHDGSFLRVTVEGGGCSGFQYKFDLDKKLNEDDAEFGENNAKVVIDNVSLEYCAGATVDYHTELIRSGFRMVANPQAEQGCSCGASFAIKLD